MFCAASKAPAHIRCLKRLILVICSAAHHMSLFLLTFMSAMPLKRVSVGKGLIEAIMAKNYYINSYSGEPLWSGSRSVPSKPSMETSYIGTSNVGNFEKLIAKVDAFCEKHGLERSDIKTHNGYLYAQIQESDAVFQKRVETWKREKAKYDELRKKWSEKRRRDEAAKKEALNRTQSDEKFVVVKLTPAQYRKLVENT